MVNVLDKIQCLAYFTLVRTEQQISDKQVPSVCGLLYMELIEEFVKYFMVLWMVSYNAQAVYKAFVTPSKHCMDDEVMVPVLNESLYTY